jgi:hypothetical protein
MGACLFCGRERRMSKEHVLPQWINETPVGEGPVSIRRVAQSGESSEYTASSAAGIVARAVCEECNNGWMSHLESAARPWLTPMIDGQQLQLVPDIHNILARWAVKTAIMFLYSTSPPVGAEAPYRSEICDGRLPTGVGVWLAAYRADPPAYNSWIRAREVEMRADASPGEIRTATAVTLTLGYYAQHVLLTPAAWSGRALELLAPAPLRQRVAKIPSPAVISWPPESEGLGIADLERHVDAFCAVGYSNPATG